MKIGKHIGVLIGLVVIATGAYAQVYSPVAVTGFNQDGIAETGTDATAVTTTDLDLSAHVMYSVDFATINSPLTSGLPNNGIITSGTQTWQLQPYNSNNVLYLSQGGAVANSLALGTLNVTTPDSFAAVSVLLFSTEKNSTVNVVLNFTDGTTTNAGNFTVLDWFGGTGSVYAGYGRTTRQTAPPYTPDGVPTDPRFYQLNIALSCADKVKLLKSITFTFLSGTSTSARLVVMALSAVTYTSPAVTANITPSFCGNSTGSIALTVTNGTSPFKYAWSTTPVQTTATASNLVPGTYTCTITGADNCTTTYTGTVNSASATTLTASSSAPVICSGQPVTLSVTATGGTLSTYTWNPGSTKGSTITVTPSATTTYVVSGKDNFGCTVSANVSVTVKPTPTSTFTVSPASACLGTSQTVTFTGNASATATYNWNSFEGAAVQSGSGQGPYTILFNTAGNYNMQLQVTDNGCTSVVTTQPVTISTPVTAAFTVSDSVICAGTVINVKFTGSAASTATALWGWGGGTVQSGSGFGPYNIQYNKSGLVTLTVKDGACVSTAHFKPITVIQNPVAAFTTDITAGCAPLSVTFTNQSQNADAFTWSFGDGGTSGDVNPVYTYNSTGVFTVKLKVSALNKCYDSVIKTNLIQVKQYPVAGFTATPVENVPLELHLANFGFNNTSQNALTYKWNFGDNTTSSLLNPSHQYQYPGSYAVTLIAMNDVGCADTAIRKFFTVIPDKVLVIPNAFSPNGDGINDTWEIAGLRGVTDCQIDIFNRWGQKMVSSHGYTPWDGTYNGKPVPVATYYYVIKTVTRTYTGWVAVIR